MSNAARSAKLPGIEYLHKLATWNGKKKFNLNNMRRISAALGNPQDRVKTIHVTGTNGKGSVVASIASILGAQGYKVGLFTSPHLMSFTERFVIDGLRLSEEKLSYYAFQVKQTSEEIGVELTFFEAIAAIAFVSFFREQVDYAVIEVGLGGRKDATNVISKPELSVIVSIGLDHQKILGDTEAEIASDKAGILKTGSTAVIGPVSNEAKTAISEVASSLGVDTRYFGDDFELVDGDAVYRDLELELPFSTQLLGAHQQRNASVAIAAARSLGIGEEAIQSGLENVYWPARLEKVDIGTSKYVIFDCAHNIDGIRALATYLSENFLSNLCCIVGVLESAPWKEMIRLLRPYISDWIIVEPDTPRAVPAVEVLNYLSSIDIRSCSSARRSDVRQIVDSSDREEFLITGSIYLVGPLRSQFDGEFRPLWKRVRTNESGN